MLRAARGLAAVLGFFVYLSSTPAQPGSALVPESDIDFFDPVVTIAPGISRELDFLLDHIQGPDGRFTQFSLKLQYPILSWFQLSLEVPLTISDPSGPAFDAGVGDINLAAQARVWKSTELRAQVDVGVALGLPTGSSSIVAGSTSIQPFAIGGIKLGPVDLISDLRYTWTVAGPVSGLELFQANAAVGYSITDLGSIVTGVTPFVELNLLKPVRGDELRVQLFVLPGFEVYLPWNTSVSTGVQLPVAGPRIIDYRVLMFLKWEF